MHWAHTIAAAALLLAAQAQHDAVWKETRSSDRNDFMTMTIVFHQPRIVDAEALFLNVSNPRSPQFGQYLRAGDIDSMFAPAPESLQKTMTWLQDAAVPPRSTRLHKGYGTLQFTASVAQISKLLGNDVTMLRHSETGERRVKDEHYAAPPSLTDHIDFINLRRASFDALSKRQTPSKLPQPPYMIQVAPDLSNCSLSWTPACIRQLYDISISTTSSPSNSMGIFGYGDTYFQSDLNEFFGKYAQFIPNGTSPEFHSINGASTNQYIDGEQDLDLQMAYPIVYPTKVEIFQTPNSLLDGIANDFLDAVDASYCTYDGGDDPDRDHTYPAFQGFQGPAMCGTYNVSNVVAISFAKDEANLPAKYVTRQCYEWMKLALQGVTVLVATGDRGVGGNFGCQINSQNKSARAFTPLFPSVCPYVTAVGATQVNSTERGYQEVAVYDKPHNYWSGGGFSGYNARPSYQDQAVTAYLDTHDPHYPAGTFNRSGRAIPDVAMLGANVTVVRKGVLGVSGGSSAATPLFGALITRINDERLLAGKGPIGFLNQILYQHPEVFTDITDGSNPGCGTPGFQTAPGWDPVSGLGSPVFPKLRDLLVGLP